MEFKKLSLAHLETATTLLPQVQEEGGLTKIIALYLADGKTAAKYRTDPTALDPFIAEAEVADADECSEILAYFFGRWQNFQNGILSSVGVPLDVLEKIKNQRLQEMMGGTTRIPDVTLQPDTQSPA